MKQLAYRIRRRLKRQYDKWRSIAKCHVRFGKHVLSYNSRYEGYNSVADYCVIRNCDIGYGTYFSPHCVADNTWIGKYCSVADDVTIGPGNHPSSVYGFPLIPLFIGIFPVLQILHFIKGKKNILYSKMSPVHMPAESAMTFGSVAERPFYRESPLATGRL